MEAGCDWRCGPGWLNPRTGFDSDAVYSGCNVETLVNRVISGESTMPLLLALTTYQSVATTQKHLPIQVTLSAEGICATGRSKLVVDQFPSLKTGLRQIEISYDGAPVGKSAIDEVRKRFSSRTLDKVAVLDCSAIGSGSVRFLISFPIRSRQASSRPLVMTVYRGAVSFE